MGSSHVYRISPRRRAFIYGCWAVFALPLLIGGVASGEYALVVAGLMVSAIMLPMFLFVERAARLIITDDGVELRQVGAILKSPWTNIIGLRLVRGSEGFVLREPMDGRGAQRFSDTAAVRMRGVSLYDSEIGQLIAEQRFIPIEAFGHWFTHGDLRQAIGQKAPQLLSSPDAATLPSTPPPQTLSRKRAILLGIVLTLSVAWGIGMATLSPETEPRAVAILELPLILVFGYLAPVNFLSGVRLLRAGRYGMGILWASIAIVQVLIMLAIIGDLVAAPLETPDTPQPK